MGNKNSGRRPFAITREIKKLAPKAIKYIIKIMDGEIERPPKMKFEVVKWIIEKALVIEKTEVALGLVRRPQHKGTETIGDYETLMKRLTRQIDEGGNGNAGEDKEDREEEISSEDTEVGEGEGDNEGEGSTPSKLTKSD